MSKSTATLRSTSGAGFEFEDLVSAWLMVKALAGEPAPCIDGVITRIQAQVSTLGWQMDDLLLTAEVNNNPSTTCRLAISVKGNVQVSATGLPEDFVKRAWAQWRDIEGPFRQSVDGLALVTRGSHAEFQATWSAVKDACSGVDTELGLSRIRNNKKQSALFDSIQRLGGEGSVYGVAGAVDGASGVGTVVADAADAVGVSTGSRGASAAPGTATGTATDTETIELIRHLHVLPTDLQFVGSEMESEAIGKCRRLLQSVGQDEAKLLWECLVSIAKEVRLRSGTVTVSDLLALLRRRFVLRHHPDYERDWQTLGDLTDDVRARIEIQLPSGLTVSRSQERAALEKSFATNHITVVHGDSGSGKSALVKSFLDDACRHCNQIWLGPEQLKAALSAVERRKLPMRAELSTVLNATAKSHNVLVIDSAERIDEHGGDQIKLRELLAKILHEHTHDLDGHEFAWRVIVTTQDVNVPWVYGGLTSGRVVDGVVDGAVDSADNGFVNDATDQGVKEGLDRNLGSGLGQGSSQGLGDFTVESGSTGTCTSVQRESPRVGSVTVGLLQPVDVKQALSHSPSLSWLASHGDAVSALTNLRTLAWVVKAGVSIVASDRRSLSLVEIVDLLWEHWTCQRADVRSFVMYLAEREASFERSFALSELQPERLTIFDNWSSNLPLHLNKRTNCIEFEHDLAADWARFQFLKQHGFDLSRWKPLAVNPLWINAIRLMGQNLLRQMSTRYGGVTSVAAVSAAAAATSGATTGTVVRPRAQWDDAFEAAQASDSDLVVDLLLDALILDPDAERFLRERVELLHANNAKHLDRLLSRFHYIATVPGLTGWDPGWDAGSNRGESSDAQRNGRHADGLNDQASWQGGGLDAAARLYFDAEYRSIVFGRWPPMLRFLVSQQQRLSGLVSCALAKVIHTWLTGTQHLVDGGRLSSSDLLRKPLAEIALSMARNVQVQKGSGVLYLSDDPLIYKAALAGVSDLPTAVGHWAVELAGRREVDLDVRRRIGDWRRQQASSQMNLSQSKKRERLITPIAMSREKLPPWPLGASRQVDSGFRDACIKGQGLQYLMRAQPELAAEVLLALVIEDQPERDGHGLIEVNLGLQYNSDADPAIFWKSPFYYFLQVEPDVALTTLIKLVNFCTDRWIEYCLERSHGGGGERRAEADSPAGGFCGVVDEAAGEMEVEPPEPIGHQATWPPGLMLKLADGSDKTFVGGPVAYARWHYRDSSRNGHLLCVLDALEKWLTQRLDAGDDLVAVVSRILRDGNSTVLLGVLVNVVKYRPTLMLECLGELVSVPDLVEWDRRQAEAAGMTGSAFTFSTWRWAREGQVVFELARDWIMAPHRQKRLLDIVIDLLWVDEGFARCLQALLPMWPVPEDRKASLEFRVMLAQLDRDNYQEVAPSKLGSAAMGATEDVNEIDGSAGSHTNSVDDADADADADEAKASAVASKSGCVPDSVQATGVIAGKKVFVCPTDLVHEIQAWQSEYAASMSAEFDYLGLAFNCENRLRDGPPLAGDEAESLVEVLRKAEAQLDAVTNGEQIAAQKLDALIRCRLAFSCALVVLGDERASGWSAKAVEPSCPESQNATITSVLDIVRNAVDMIPSTAAEIRDRRTGGRAVGRVSEHSDACASGADELPADLSAVAHAVTHLWIKECRRHQGDNTDNCTHGEHAVGNGDDYGGHLGGGVGGGVRGVGRRVDLSLDYDREWEAAVLKVLTSGDSAAVATVVHVAFKNRVLLGSAWWRLLVAGLFWSGLSLLAVQRFDHGEDGGGGEDRDDDRIWSIWLARLRRFPLRGVTAEPDDLNLDRVLEGLARLDFRRKTRVYNDALRAGRHPSWGKPKPRQHVGLDGCVLSVLFNWLIQDDGTGDLDVDARLALRVWEYEAQRAKALAQSRDDSRGEYAPMQSLGYDILQKLAALTISVPDVGTGGATDGSTDGTTDDSTDVSTARQSRTVWEPVLAHGPAAHYALDYFIQCFFRQLTKDGDPVLPDLQLEPVWRSMVEFGLDAKWPESRFWFRGETLLCGLLGFGNEHALSKLKPGAVLRMRDIYKRWAAKHLARDVDCVTRFCNFLCTGFGSSLRLDGLCWLATALEQEESAVARRREHWDKAVLNAIGEFLVVVINDDSRDLQQNAKARDAYTELTALLVIMNEPVGLTLQERIKGLR